MGRCVGGKASRDRPQCCSGALEEERETNVEQALRTIAVTGGASAEGRRQASLEHGVQAGDGPADLDGRGPWAGRRCRSKRPARMIRTKRGRDRLADFRGKQQSHWHFRKQSALMRSYPWVWQWSGGGRDGILACYDSQGEQITQHSTRPQ